MTFAKYLSLYKFKSKIPDLDPGEGEILPPPRLKIHRDRHPYIGCFEDPLKLGGGLKFETFDKSRSSGTQKLDKKGS